MRLLLPAVDRVVRVDARAGETADSSGRPTR